MKFFTAPKLRMYLKQKLHLKLIRILPKTTHQTKSAPTTKIAPNDRHITIAGQILKKIFQGVRIS